ncbi:hypothetical protein CTI12_AA469550 [Artemisia annua]|uniref:Uncharacterized protein n=1 Tax=Artemisia annua TaxID=35608 RepID=A0A2U1LP84_ARTAN|nr:hypothetical protein CTI12_AA469550 [Artemisia annua]
MIKTCRILRALISTPPLNPHRQLHRRRTVICTVIAPPSNHHLNPHRTAVEPPPVPSSHRLRAVTCTGTCFDCNRSSTDRSCDYDQMMILRAGDDDTVASGWLLISSS